MKNKSEFAGGKDSWDCNSLTVFELLEKLKNYPLSGKKLKGPLNKFRSLRSWPYLIIYQYQNSKEVIKINVIQHRQSSYK